jgi:lipopolysaccharide export LptBFGC system permease protein LptF
MPKHDPIPKPGAAEPGIPDADSAARQRYERTALAWERYKRLMTWMSLAAVAAVLLALIYLKSSGGPVPIHMLIATIAGVGFSVLLGTGLMGLVYFSNNSGHDDNAHQGTKGAAKGDDDDRS